MIITVTLTPALDKTVTIPNFETGTLNRIETARLDAGGKGINVSKVLRVLGVRSTAMGILGGSTGKGVQNTGTILSPLIFSPLIFSPLIFSPL